MPTTAPLTHEFLLTSPVKQRQPGDTSYTTRPGFAGNGDGRWKTDIPLGHQKYFAHSSIPLKAWDESKDAQLGRLVDKHGRPGTMTSSTLGSPLATKLVDWKVLAKDMNGAGFFTTKESCEQRWADLNRPKTVPLIADRVNRGL